MWEGFFSDMLSFGFDRLCGLVWWWIRMCVWDWNNMLGLAQDFHNAGVWVVFVFLRICHNWKLP